MLLSFWLHCPSFQQPITIAPLEGFKLLSITSPTTIPFQQILVPQLAAETAFHEWISVNNISCLDLVNLNICKKSKFTSVIAPYLHLITATRHVSSKRKTGKMAVAACYTLFLSITSSLHGSGLYNHNRTTWHDNGNISQGLKANAHEMKFAFGKKKHFCPKSTTLSAQGYADPLPDTPLRNPVPSLNMIIMKLPIAYYLAVGRTISVLPIISSETFGT